MMSPYLFPLIDVVLVEPNKSRCNSSKRLEDEIMFLLEK